MPISKGTQAVIVSYRSAGEIKELIEALRRQTMALGAVHICENGGPEAFATLVAALSPGLEARPDPERIEDRDLVAATTLDADGMRVVCHLAGGNLGYAGAINACLRRMASEAWACVWIINPDATPEPGALAALSARLARGDVGVVGGSVVFSESGRVQTQGGIWRKWIGRGLNINFGRDPTEPVDAASVERDMDYVSGACMLVSRAYVEAVGPMDEGYFLYCEEVDWCARRGAFRLGFAPEAVIGHGHGTAIGSSRNRRLRSRLSVYLDERNKLLFTRRHHAGVYPLVALITLALLGQYLVSGAYTNFRHGLAGWLAGLRGETGPPPWFEPPPSSPAFDGKTQAHA